jgi:hypothetical protein
MRQDLLEHRQRTEIVFFCLFEVFFETVNIQRTAHRAHRREELHTRFIGVISKSEMNPSKKQTMLV